MWLTQALVRKSAESGDGRGACSEGRAGPPGPGLTSASSFVRAAHAVSGCKGCGLTTSVRQAGVREYPKGSWTQGAVKPLSCHSAPRVVPRRLDLLPELCQFCCFLLCPGVQGLLRHLSPGSGTQGAHAREPQMFCRPQAASAPHVEEPSAHHPHPQLHPGRASMSGSRLQLQNASEPSFKCVDS